VNTTEAFAILTEFIAENDSWGLTSNGEAAAALTQLRAELDEANAANSATFQQWLEIGAELDELREKVAWLESELMGLCAWGHLVYDMLPPGLVKDATPAIITDGLPGQPASNGVDI
jgi:hypothetical protein